jgi:hypothetical protein
MKKTHRSLRLKLHRETLRQLDSAVLENAVGAATSITVCMHTCADTCRCPTTSRQITVCTC